MKRLLPALLLLPLAANAATVTHSVATTDTTNTPNTSASFTPAANDILVVGVCMSGTVDAAPTLTSSVGGQSFALIEETPFGASDAHRLYVFVANVLSTNVAQTVTADAPDTGTGTAIMVEAITGVTRTGTDAIRQHGEDPSNSSGQTPTVVFGGSALTGNPTIGFVCNTTVTAATVTEPSGWTEQADTGFATPDIGAEVVTRNSGFTSTTITWGSTFGSNGAAAAVEVDTSSNLPTFTAGPSAGTITSTTIPVTFTSDTTGTVKGTACTNGNAGNKTETLAGQCSGGGAAVATISEAVTATVGDGASFTGLSSGTTYDLGFVIDATTDSDLYSLADQTTDSGSPGFNEGIDCTGSDSDTYLCTYDANADADDIFLCVMKKDASAPANGAAVVTCSGGIGTATEAATGSADSLSVDVTMTGGAPPIADIYSTASASGPTYSSVGSDLDVPLPAPTGRQYVTKSGAPDTGEEGILDDASPAAVDGDIMDAATHADSFASGPAVHAITLNANTTFEIVADGDTSQHKFTRRFYDVSAAAWSDATAVLYCVNNLTATYLGPNEWEGDVPFLFEKDVETTHAMDSFWDDPEGDDLTHNILNLPAGGSEDGETLTADFSTYGYYPTVTLEATDVCGDTEDEVVQFVVGLRLPDVLSWLQDESRWDTHSLFASANDDSFASYYLPRHAIR